MSRTLRTFLASEVTPFPQFYRSDVPFFALPPMTAARCSGPQQQVYDLGPLGRGEKAGESTIGL
ncbi:hypothetical protein ARZXY2_4577 (plasmid) [Arthrobacter sp. ZXY-2]|nr:hypothetical protein ARZXY2_4577 [Arthrobacter sp. ZXY-2]